jgi:hypothetical protein
MQKETRFKIKVREALKKLSEKGLPLWFTKTQQVSIRGTPDFILCINGTFVALELKKSATEKADELQTYNLEKINNAKGIGLVVNPENWNSIFEIIKTLAEGGKHDRTKFQNN